MTVVLFQPHSDDAALFAAYACVRENPVVVTVLRSERQATAGVDHDTRELEDRCAFAELGVTAYEQWPYSDASPDWGAVVNAMRLLDERLTPHRVFAPAPEQDGHDQHNQVGELARQVFGDRLIGYLTYVRGCGHSTGGVEVPCEPDWVARKLRALACYRSQIWEPSTRPWFVELLDVREWVTAC